MRDRHGLKVAIEVMAHLGAEPSIAFACLRQRLHHSGNGHGPGEQRLAAQNQDLFNLALDLGREIQR